MSSHDFVQHGRALVDQGQYQEAVKVCRLGLLAHPTELDGRLVLGSALIALRRYDEVLAEMAVALEIDGEDAWALALRGEALLQKGDAFQAAQALERARSRAPNEEYILELYRVAEHKLSLEGHGAPSGAMLHEDAGADATRDYPAHPSSDFAAALSAEFPAAFPSEFSDHSENFTRPDPSFGPAAYGRTPSPAVLAVGDRSGTMELDPSIDSIEMLEDDPLAEPPGAALAAGPAGNPALARTRPIEVLEDSLDTIFTTEGESLDDSMDITHITEESHDGDFSAPALAATPLHDRIDTEQPTGVLHPVMGSSEYPTTVRPPERATGHSAELPTQTLHALDDARSGPRAIRSPSQVPTQALTPVGDVGSRPNSGLSIGSGSRTRSGSEMPTASHPSLSPPPPHEAAVAGPRSPSIPTQTLQPLGPGEELGAGSPSSSSRDEILGRRSNSHVPTQAFVVGREESVVIEDEDDELIEVVTGYDEDNVPEMVHDSEFYLDEDDDGYDDSYDGEAFAESDDATAHFQRAPAGGGRRHDDVEEGRDFDDEMRTLARPRGTPPPGSRSSTSPQTPRSRELDGDHGASGPSYGQEYDDGIPAAYPASGRHDVPGIDDLFPDSEPQLSPREVVEDVVRQFRDPNLSPASLAALGDQPPGSNRADMRLIRAGLGLDPEGTGITSVPEDAIQEPPRPAPVRPAPAVIPRPAPPIVRPGAPMPRPAAPSPRLVHPAPGAYPGSPAFVSPRPRRPSAPPPDAGRAPALASGDVTGRVPKRRSRWVYALYVMSTLVVIAGGVFLGFKIREIRLDRDIGFAERRADAAAAQDLYQGYLEAKEQYDGIVSVRASERTQAQLARIEATIAAEFGEGYESAAARVDQVADSKEPDAAVARALLAIADGRIAEAKSRVDDVLRDIPGEPIAPYLIGQVALLEGRADDAETAFNDALSRQNRPAVYVGLGRAHLARGSFSKAKAAFQRALDIAPGHPAAIIFRARLALAAGSDKEDGQGYVAELEELLGRDLDGVAAPSPWQQAQAALVLTSLAAARGDDKAVTTGLARCRELAPERELRFTRAFIALLLRVGQVKEARAEARRALEQWPDRVDLRAELARLALARGDPSQALELLGDAVAGDPSALVVRGRALLDLGEVTRANRDFDAALSQAPSSVEAIVARAEGDIAAGAARNALDRLEKIYRPEAGEGIQVAYAAALRETGDLDKAEAIVGRLVADGSSRAIAEKARLEVAQGAFEAAVKSYARALEQAPGRVDIRLEAALLGFDTGRIAQARKALDDLAAAYPSSWTILVEAARLQIATGAHDKALATLDAAEKLAAGKEGKGKGRILRERGRLALKEGRSLEAIDQFTLAREADSSDPEIQWLLIVAYYEATKEAEVRRAVGDLLKFFPGEAARRELAMGQREVQLERYSEAIRFFENARDRYREKNAPPRKIAEAVYRIGRAHLLDNNLEATEKTLRRATEIDPGNAAAFYYLSQTLGARGRTADAIKALEKSLKIDVRGAYPDAWYDLGIARLELGRREGAAKAFERYLELWPKGDVIEDAQFQLRKLR